MYEVPINICISTAIVLAERITRISSIFGDDTSRCKGFDIQEALKEIEPRVSLSKVPLALSNAMGAAILHSEEVLVVLLPNYEGAPR